MIFIKNMQERTFSMLEYWFFLMDEPYYGLLYLLRQQFLSVIDEPESKRLKDGLCLVHLVI